MSDIAAISRGVDDALATMARTLRSLAPATDDAAMVDQIRLAEELKSAAAAFQARVTSAFVCAQREANLAAGVKPERAERGIAAQVALARRCSPYQARRYVGWSRILTSELPATLEQLQAGTTTEWRAMIVARETIWLSRADRAAVDAEVAPLLAELGDKQVEARVKKAAYRLDPEGFTDRLSNADSERRVTLRPAPDVMGRLTALLPVKEAVAVYTTLARDAAALRAAGDQRSRNQIMADLLVERITGISAAAGVPVEIELVMPVDSLIPTNPQPASRANDPSSDCTESEHGTADRHDGAGPGPSPAAADGKAKVGNEPAHLQGFGPIPAPLARSWILDPSRTAPMWLRRMFTSPDTGQLMTMDSKRRLFTKNQAKFLRLRDQVCRTPYCGAPIRHADHIVPAGQGGPTSTANAEGLCEACNYSKESPGWHARPGPQGTVTITTPTGHTYVSRPPDPPGARAKHRSPVEQRLAKLIDIQFHRAA